MQWHCIVPVMHECMHTWKDERIYVKRVRATNIIRMVASMLTCML